MKNITCKIIAALLLATSLFSCDKPYEMELELAVLNEIVNLKADGGTTPVMVYSNTDWTVTFEAPCNWASLDRLEGNGMGEITFAYAPNYGVARKVGIIFSSENESRTVYMVQAGAVVSRLAFVDDELTVSNVTDRIRMTVDHNLKYNLDCVSTSVVYGGVDDEWLSNFTLEDDALYADIKGNTSGADRNATVAILCVDGTGKRSETKLSLIQSDSDPVLTYTSEPFNGLRYTAYVDCSTNISWAVPKLVLDGNPEWIEGLVWNDSKKQLGFILGQNDTGDIRTAQFDIVYTDASSKSWRFPASVTQKQYIPSISFPEIRDKVIGTEGSFAITENMILEAVVIGDCDSPNMEVNPNTDLKGMDLAWNDRFNYVQDAKGEYGFRLQFASAEDNTLKRFSTVNINLNGTTIVKEAAPERYTISGITLDNILYYEEGEASSVVVKSRMIGALTPKDIYTYVSLRDLEITFKTGSYTNVHDGYATLETTLLNSLGEQLNPKGSSAGFFDCSPLSLRDKNGGHLYMLTNSRVPWRRYGNGVPQGSGFVNGIIVHSSLPRFGLRGDVGDYSIRVLEESDLHLNEDPFSKKIVEWAWDGSISLANAFKPTSGEGTIACGSNVSANPSMTTDYNMLTVRESAQKQINNGALRWGSSKWWGDDDSAPYFEISCSTEGISGTNLVLNFTSCTGNLNASSIYAPSIWHVEYSTDGSNFRRACADFAIHPIVWWTTAAYWAVPGLHEITVNLPSELFGKDKIYLRIVASSKACADGATAQDPYGGVTTGHTGTDTFIRFGEVSVQYN